MTVLDTIVPAASTATSAVLVFAQAQQVHFDPSAWTSPLILLIPVFFTSLAAFIVQIRKDKKQDVHNAAQEEKINKITETVAVVRDNTDGAFTAAVNSEAKHARAEATLSMGNVIALQALYAVTKAEKDKLAVSAAQLAYEIANKAALAAEEVSRVRAALIAQPK